MSPYSSFQKLNMKKVITLNSKLIQVHWRPIRTKGSCFNVKRARPVASKTRGTITLIAGVQIALGLIFLLSPGQFATLLGLPPAPAWTDWMFAMLGARALGFAYGMIVALRDIRRNASWLAAMIIVQALDWIATILAVARRQGRSPSWSRRASFLPLLFMAALAPAETLRAAAAVRAARFPGHNRSSRRRGGLFSWNCRTRSLIAIRTCTGETMLADGDRRLRRIELRARRSERASPRTQTVPRAIDLTQPWSRPPAAR